MPAFTVKKKLTNEEQKEYNKRKKARWNSYNLIPCESEGYEYNEELEYSYKDLCYKAANGVPSEKDRLYTECSLLSVYEQVMFQKTNNW